MAGGSDGRAGPDPPRPLAAWRLTEPLRAYQEDLLAAVDPADGATLHIVAPPGAGKTLLGLALAAANGRRALVLAPTTIVRAQWAEQARRFFRVPAGAPPDASSDAPASAPPVADAPPVPGRSAAHLTALTYQSLAVVDDSGPWQEAARRRWIDELARDGRNPARACAWLDELAASNRSAYTRGIRSRAAAVRAGVDELDDAAVAALLSPSARERLDALVDAGVATIVVDECHHLRAHWAVVVRYLSRRLAAAGRAPTLIGLTATAPSSEDPSYARYHALLGEVDAEVPVPAVIRAGCLAPARELAWFTLPAPEETGFLATAGAELRHRVAQILLAPDGVDYLLGVIAPGAPADVRAADDPRLVGAIVAGFDADPRLAAAAAALLRRTGDYVPTPLSVLAVPLLPALDALDVDEELHLLARYALDRLLPDADRRGEWDAVRETLRGFGMHLTDAGIRAGRSPVDVITAGSRAKDVAAVDILRRELAALGERMRAVVVTDAAERSAVHRALDVLAAPDRTGAAGGALRCYEVLLSDADLRALNPVLLTGREVRVPHGQDGLLAELRERTGLDLPARDDGWSLRAATGAGRAELVLAVSGLVAAGRVHLVVGTRGLLGEGWDCPAVNTLVDLTTVTTSTAVAQLRGRSMRLDPAWPGKVAHVWSVTCLLPAGAGLRSSTDLDRLRRKAESTWSVAPRPGEEDGPADPADESEAGDPAGGPGAANPVVETGLVAVLGPARLRTLERLAAGAAPADVEALNADIAAGLDDRAGERCRWLAGAAVGPDRRGRHGAVLEAVAITGAAGLLRRGSPGVFWSAAALAVLDVMIATGRVDGGAADRPGPELLVLDAGGAAGGPGAETVVALTGVGAAPGARYAEALCTLLSVPVRRPRFVLEVAPLTLARTGFSPPGPLRRWLAGLLGCRDWGPGGRSLYLAVPRALASSRADVEIFLAAWERRVGPCRLHLVSDAEAADALLASRGGRGVGGRVSARRTRRWAER
ncbi:DEAD/DEAH box helicase [Actinomyces sp. oral taxon 414]|uniref:DEAD/DEAH box helicase family protein n=1 Tax=Actinomyces sp. oral taxon 414 TaxID=712122 RepID=UPI0006AF9E9F|nr:DEAD/DEAH box helicase family protein [Actinomyces sp. oral taxon 414]ALC98807.1 DEAD/DEAH box helicase [Actinomyces sp. oral taxon 414]